MARFLIRTKDNLTAPAQYIQTTDSVSRPMAVMMRLVMIFVIIAILFCLFFAGKWAYDQITGNNDAPSNPAAGISSGESVSNSTSEGSGSTATVTSNGTGSAVVTNRTPGTSSSTNDVQNSTSPRGTTGATTTVTTNNSTTNTNAVPNTGTGSLVGVFVIASTLGALAYRFYLEKTLSTNI